ncbi:MAG TPA: hypothetical protein VK809_01800, partial [Bacteroidia bacterium]|nr:hypothetical protein [Bacteroidia bacterium]
MRNSILRNGLFGIFTITAFIASAQNVAVNTSGNNAYTGAILDLSNHNTAGANGLLPPYVSLSNTATQLTPPITGGTSSQLGGLLVYNTSTNLSGPGLYYWYYNSITPANSAWIYIGNGTVGGTGTLNYLARWTPNGTTLGTGVSQDNGTTAAISTVAAAPVATQMLTVVGNATAINAVIGTTAFTGGAAVKGSVANAGASGGFGVEGLISGAGGGQQYSLYGSSTVTAGNGYGVYGQ